MAMGSKLLEGRAAQQRGLHSSRKELFRKLQRQHIVSSPRVAAHSNRLATICCKRRLWSASPLLMCFHTCLPTRELLAEAGRRSMQVKTS